MTDAHEIGMRLRQCVSEHADDFPPGDICADHQLQEHFGLDSLERMDLLITLEEEFSVVLPDDEFERLHTNPETTVQELQQAVERRITTKAKT